MTNRCLECDENPSLYKDPRTPPLEEEDCLCEDCYVNALWECCEEAEENFKYFVKELETFGKSYP